MNRYSALIIAFFLLVLAAICVIPIGGPLGVPIFFALYMLFGWVGYLIRVVPQVQVNWADVGVGVAALVLFGIGVHYFCRWFSNARRETQADATSDSGRWRLRWSLSIVSLVVLMFVAGTAMIGVVHQTVGLVTMDEPIFAAQNYEGARRNGSLSNTRQLALGAANHESAKQHFPSGCTMDNNGRLLHGWMVQILPFIEEQLLYEKIDLSRPWDDDANAEHFRQQVSVFMSPKFGHSPDDDGFPLTHYSSNVHAIGGDRPRRLEDFSDGLGQTILTGEAAGNYKPWGSPTNWRDPAQGLGRSPDGFGGPWSGGQTVVSFADGSARALSNDIDPQVLRALATPAGRDKVDLNDL